MVTGLEIRELGYSYREKAVIENISLSIGRGTIFGILGPNGCGKSTFLKNLNRNLSPHHGCVLLDDENITDMRKRDIAKKISVVPQSNEINFAFTVREIVEMGRMPFQDAFSGLSGEDAAKVDEAIRFTGLENMQDRQVNTMSGGERQRVIIARAIAQDPEVLLMDEPTLHLDVNMQFEILDLVRRLCREKGLTVVIVSHDLPMAARYCDEIAMIHSHRILCSGRPSDVLTSENMRTVFNVDAEYGIDPYNGLPTVFLHGVSKKNPSE